MIAPIKQLLQRDFVKDVSTLMVGTLIGQLITIASMPILSRIYTPSEYGIFSIFFNIACMLGYVANAKLDNAIILPADDAKAQLVFKVGLFSTIMVSFATLLAVCVLPNSMLMALHGSDLQAVRFFLPLAVFLLGSYQLVYTWFNRIKFYKGLSANKVVQNSATVAVSYGFGALKAGGFGLVAGFIIGYVVSMGVLLRKLPASMYNSVFHIKRKEIAAVFTEYKNFPLFLVPFTFINTFTVNILVFILAYYYDTQTIGLYNQAVKVVNYPLMLVTASFSTVFYQRLNVSTQQIRLYVKSVLINFGLACIVVIPFIFWGEAIFSVAFGSQWTEAGRIAKYILPVAVFGFAARNVSDVYSVTNANHWLLLWQIIYLIGSISVIYFFSSSGIYYLLTCFAIWGSFVYILLALGGLYLLKLKNDHERQQL